MVTSTADTVDLYLSEQKPQRMEALSRLRAIIKEVAPAVSETMKYRMPTYEYRTGALCALASQKQYMSLYVEVEILDRYRDQLAHLNLGKSCIRFRKIEDLPIDVVKAILEATVERLDAVAAHGSDR